MLEAAHTIAWLTAGLLIAAIFASARLAIRLIPRAPTSGRETRAGSAGASTLFIAAVSLGILAAGLAVTSRLFG